MSADEKWFGIRTVFEYGAIEDTANPRESLFEERVIIIKACDGDQAVQRGEALAERYAEENEVTFLGYVHAYEMFDDVGDGAEVYSVTRPSTLAPDQYLERYCYRPSL